MILQKILRGFSWRVRKKVIIHQTPLRERNTMETSKQIIYNAISKISPWDDLEKQHIEDALSWIESGVPIFRIQKPDVPDKHLVSYFVVIDPEHSKVLLVDHKKAQLWLPSGGHVELNEDPKEAVIRECLEEFFVEADFLYETPIFLTSTMTVGLTAGHTDISLWYVLKGNHQISYDFDRDEFHKVAWFDFDQIPYEKTDPHMHRFMRKLQGIL